MTEELTLAQVQELISQKRMQMDAAYQERDAATDRAKNLKVEILDLGKLQAKLLKIELRNAGR